jgi:hypothetical protein
VGDERFVLQRLSRHHCLERIREQRVVLAVVEVPTERDYDPTMYARRGGGLMTADGIWAAAAIWAAVPLWAIPFVAVGAALFTLAAGVTWGPSLVAKFRSGTPSAIGGQAVQAPTAIRIGGRDSRMQRSASGRGRTAMTDSDTVRTWTQARARLDQAAFNWMMRGVNSSFETAYHQARDEYALLVRADERARYEALVQAAHSVIYHLHMDGNAPQSEHIDGLLKRALAALEGGTDG